LIYLKKHLIWAKIQPDVLKNATRRTETTKRTKKNVRFTFWYRFYLPFC